LKNLSSSGSHGCGLGFIKILLTLVSNLKLVLFLTISGGLSFLCYKHLSLATFLIKIELFNIYIENFGSFFLLIFVILYITCVSFSVPTASVFTVIAGYLYGPLVGGSLAYFSSLSGAVLLFTMVRVGLKNSLLESTKKHPAFSNVDFGLNNNPYRYMFFLRLLPVFPFWLVNLAPSILGIRFKVFFVTTALGILPGTFIIAILGDKIRVLVLSKMESVIELRSDPVFFFAMLGLSVIIIFPIFWRIKKRVR